MIFSPQYIGFFKYHSFGVTVSISENLHPLFPFFLFYLIFRKEGGHYGFTASISDQDNEKLVVGNPMQRTHVWDKVRVRKKTFSKLLAINTNSTSSTPIVDLTNHWQRKGDAFACGSVGEVNPGNVFKAPGSIHSVVFICHHCLPVRSVAP